MNATPEIDLSNKFTPIDLNELSEGLGQRILSNLSDTISASHEHAKNMCARIEELKEVGLTPEEVYIDIGPRKGVLLSEHYKIMEENITNYMIVESRF